MNTTGGSGWSILGRIGCGAFGKSVLPQLLVFHQWAVRIIFAIARLFTRLVRMFFTNVREGRVARSWLEVDAANLTGRIVIFINWTFALVMMYPDVPGSDSATFKGVSVFVGLLISWGGSGMVGQVMGGFVLMYTRALKVGQYVRIGEHEGTVESVGFMSMSHFCVESEVHARLAVPEQRPAVASALCANIQDEFNEHGVQIMSPHFVANPPAPVVVPKSAWQGRPPSEAR